MASTKLKRALLTRWLHKSTSSERERERERKKERKEGRKKGRKKDRKKQINNERKKNEIKK